MALRKQTRKDHADWFNGAVPSFGPDTARLLIVGLAPGLKGAHRTGRPFTGDASGQLLFETLGKLGLSAGRFANEATDSVQLQDVMITNAVRCVPPQNKPVAAEIKECRQFLRGRIDALERLKIIVPLGRIAHESTVKALALKSKDHPFAHAATYQIEHKGRQLTILSSFHCSRYNINTRRLTPAMFEAIFRDAKAILARS